MKIKINIELIMLYVIVISMTSLFGLLKISSDIVLIECLIFILYVEIKYCKIKVKSSKYEFKWFIILLVPLIIMSSIRSYQLYGQAIMLGIRAQRMIFALYFMYFPLSKLYNIKKINRSDIEKMIYSIGTIQMILYTIYFVCKGKIGLLNYDYDYRYGGMRLRVDCCIINLLFILSINNYIKGRKKKENLFLIIFNVLTCALMLKTRLLIVAYIGVIIVTLFLWKKDLRKKFLICIGGLLIVPIIFKSTIIKDTIDTILENDKNDIRKIGKEYYIECLKESPLAGRGYINTLCRKAYIGAGMDRNIYLVDNGIYGFAFVYGGIGILWFIILWFKILFKSVKKYKENEDYSIILYLVYITILLPNITWWVWAGNGMIAMTIVLSIMSDKEDEHEKNKKVSIAEKI